MAKVDITLHPIIKKLLKSRYPQTVLQIVLLIGFVFTILAGLIGTPVGSHNFGIIFVWIAWWAILILILVPFLGRSWCAVCPIPLIGEWFQRGAILNPPSKQAPFIPRRWPKIFQNSWFQNVFFIFLALSSSVLLTTPKITAMVLAGMLTLGTFLTFWFERRTFCRFLCPVGGFIGLYSQNAPLELRTQNKKICLTCKEKPCYNGSSLGYGCPWNTFPTALNKNTYCGICLECIRTCPNDNISLNLRPFLADLSIPLTRLDETFKAFIMLGSAMVYTGVFLGPWAVLKDAAYSIGSPNWFVYAFGVVALILVLLPGLFALTLSLSKTNPTRLKVSKTEFSALATALVPLGLMFWVAFTLSFVMTNGSYILVALSDPLGLGWNLFGTANVAWQPILTSILPIAQTTALLGGLGWFTRVAYRIAEPMRVSVFPILAYGFSMTILMMWMVL